MFFALFTQFLAQPPTALLLLPDFGLQVGNSRPQTRDCLLLFFFIGATGAAEKRKHR